MKIGEEKKEIVISKEEKNAYYKYVDSALVKDIRWDLIKNEMEKQLKPYDEYLKESYYSEEYLKRKYPTEEEYKKSFTQFSTYAVLTPDGEWHEPGKMGWWAISDATPEQEVEFEKNYEEKFIKTANPEWNLTIVDCHI